MYSSVTLSLKCNGCPGVGGSEWYAVVDQSFGMKLLWTKSKQRMCNLCTVCLLHFCLKMAAIHFIVLTAVFSLVLIVKKRS